MAGTDGTTFFLASAIRNLNLKTNCISIMKKILIGILILLGAVVAVVFWYVHHLRGAALPVSGGERLLTGLRQPVTVYHDSVGTPHIYAANAHDLYFVTGYLMAGDRMWQMDLLRRVGQGRLSEILGRDLLETDVLLRKLRIPDNAQRSYQHLPDSIQKALNAFADGVNAYLKMQGDDLPFEFKILGYRPEAWDPRHCLYLVGYMAWDLETGFRMEAISHAIREKAGPSRWKGILPPDEKMPPYVYQAIPKGIFGPDTVVTTAMARLRALAPPIFEASNNWVIAPKKSATGTPLFSNDMHLGLSIPGIWWRAHQHIEGELDVTGVLLPGVPLVVAGHNDRIAWGMTNVMLDGADFYVETIDPADPDRYRLDGQWKKMKVVEETFHIKGEDSPVVRRLRFTHRGPILTEVNQITTPPLSMRWVGNELPEAPIALYRLNRASDWEEFRDAVRHFTTVSQNIAYADVEGNIGLQMVGSVPVRQGHPYLFFPGDTSAYDWTGFVPFDSLPYEYNPSRGFVASANQATARDLRYYISMWQYLPYRARRIHQFIKAHEKLTVDDIRTLLNDHYSMQAHDLRPPILKILNAFDGWNAAEKKALRILKAWDLRYETDHPAPLLFESTLRHLMEEAARDEMGDTLFRQFRELRLYQIYFLHNLLVSHTAGAWADRVTTPQQETLSTIVVAAFRKAVEEVLEKYADIEDARWGQQHQLALQHPLGKVRLLDLAFHLNRYLPAPGHGHTVNPFNYSWNAPYYSRHGASQKHIYVPGRWDAGRSILPTGQSGIPASPDYCNQTKAYVNGELFPDRFSTDAVRKHARDITRFVPSEK